MADISKKSYMSKSNLELYDAKLKEEMTSLDVSVLTNAKSYTDKELQDFASEVDIAVDALISAIDGKSDKGHTHTVDSALSATSTNPVQNKVVNSALDAKVPITRTVNGKALTSNITLSASDVGADTSGSASKVQSNLDVVEDKVDDHIGNSNIHFTATERTKLAGIAEGANKYSHPSSGVTAGTYKSVTVNSQGHVTSGSNPTTLAGYGITDAEAKGTVNTHNTNSSAHNDIRIALSDLTTKVNNFLDADDTTTDQLSELIALINANKTSIETITSGKVNVSDIVNNLTTNVSNKPLSAAQGVSLKALIDALDGDKVDKVSGKGLSTNDYTTAEKNKLNGVASGAEVNQNAFSNVVVGTTTISADSKTDSLVLVGDNVTITPDATNDKVTFAVANGTTSAKGLVQLTDSTSSTSTATAATPNSVKSAYDLANTAKTNAGTAQSRADSAYDLANNHASNTTVHITSAERTSWNNAVTEVAKKANSADIAATKYVGTATQNNTYHKIYNFGNWGTGNWMQKSFSMLISSRAGETIWVSLAANDSNTSAGAFRLINRYSKIAAIYYSVSESAIYVTAAGWANNICAHILSNVNGDYVPTVETVSGLASDCVEINIVEFGIDSTSAIVGDSSVSLKLGGKDARPTYNDAEMAMASDIPTDYAKSSHSHDYIQNGTVGIKSSDSNEISFASNVNYVYFGYDNRMGSPGLVDTYRFGTHSGAANSSNGAIECGKVTAGGTVTVGNKATLQYDSTNECLNFVFV